MIGSDANKSIRKGYSDGPFGQIHWRMMEPEAAPTRPDLYCFHPAPFSGLAFSNIMPHFAKDRRVIAPDYPGHGGSDAFKADATVAEYAQAMLSAIDDLSDDRPVDLTGFHTGNLVAIELSLVAATKVRRLALVDVPAFDAEARAKYLGIMAKPLEITPDINCLEKPWDLGMTKRLDSQGPDRSFEMFVEQLRHGKNMNAAFHAGFSYDVESRLPVMKHPALVLASQSGLLEATRTAAKLMPTAKLVERLDIKRAVLDEAAAITADELMLFFDEADA